MGGTKPRLAARQLAHAADRDGDLGRGVRWGLALSAPVWAGLALLLVG